MTPTSSITTFAARACALALALGSAAASHAACQIISIPLRAEAGAAEQLIATTGAGASLGPATTTTATVIYNNYARPPFLFDGELGVAVTGTLSPWGIGYQAHAVPFTPAQDVTLTRAQLAFFVPTPEAGELRIGIHHDAAGLPGAVLKSVVPTGLATGINTVRFGQVPLTGGTPYWLVVRPKVAASATSVTWDDSCLDDFGPKAMHTGRGWQLLDGGRRPAMKLIGLL